MLKKLQLLMLPTNQKVKLFLGAISGQLQLNQLDWYDKSTLCQHLYFLSDEEIKEGDWVYDIDGDIGQAIGTDKEEWSGNKKIIATTDSSLTYHNPSEKKSFVLDYLPQPSPSFIEKYIEKYNKGEQITEVMVEYESQWKRDDGKLSTIKESGNNSIPGKFYDIPKVNPKDNTITIKPIKDSYTRDEVEIKVRNVIIHCVNSFKQGKEFDVNEWIENNL